MSPIYVGFCVMKCAFIAMFVSVYKIVNFFFFLVRIFPTHMQLKALILYSVHMV